MAKGQKKDSVIFHVDLPISLHERAFAVGKRIRSTVSSLIRDSLSEKIEYLEAKHRADEDRAVREKEAKQLAQQNRRSLKSLDEKRLADAASLFPRALPKFGEPAEDEVAVEDPTEALYQKHAARIVEVVDDASPTEKRMRIAEAVHAIKYAAPLTGPGEAEIVKRLQAIVVSLRDKKPAPAQSATRVVDDKVGREIDTSSVRTFGDVNLDDTDNKEI